MSHAFAYAISDAIVRVRPYNTTYQDGALFHELYDLLLAQIELVGMGVLIRAGVTVGQVYIGKTGKGPVFGPGMARAYEIESCEAVYPRIVVDPLVLKQHKNDKRLRSEFNSIEEELRVLRRIVSKGDDGKLFIDYLASDEEFDDPGLFFGYLQDHAKLVRKGLNAQLDARTKNKYSWLRDYHNHHVKQLKATILSSKKRREAFYQEYETDPEDYFKDIAV